MRVLWDASALLLGLAAWAGADWRVSGDWSRAGLVLEGLQVQADGAVALAALDPEANLALGRTVTDDYDRTVPLSDGAIDEGSSEWLSGSPNVYGRNFTVDLGMDRAVNRVRVLAGGSAVRQPEYYIRGYRIEVATERQAEGWHTVAEVRDNRQLNPDTRADSTWLEVAEGGAAIAQLGRYVRFTIIRQDRSNWVAVGEIEVYGTGYVASGSASGRLGGSEPVNAGRVTWLGDTPAGTGVDLWLREADRFGAEWEEAEAEDGAAFYAGGEPIEALEYRMDLHTAAPLSTPVVRQLQVECDSVLVAGDVRGSAAPDTVTRGEPVSMVYTAQIDAGPGDYGVDLLRLAGVALEVAEVRIDGRPVSSQAAATQWTPDGRGVVVELAPEERLVAPTTVEVEGEGVFMEDRTAMRLAVASRQQWERDGFVNWQNGRPADDPLSWTVVALGGPTRLIGGVEVSPRPFSPDRDGVATFEFAVGNVRQMTEVTVTLYSLDGRRVRRLSQTGVARVYRFEWDGRDGRGRVVDPGLYLYEARVDAEGRGARRRGSCVVAY